MALEQLLKDPRIKTALSSDFPAPLYHQVYLFLKEKIHLGEIGFGEKMPTEHEISEAFGVSRITAKRAMDELGSEGYISRQRGKGSHVTYKNRSEQVKAPLSGFLESLQIIGKDTTVKSLDFGKQQPPMDIQERFGIKPGQELIRSVRLRYAGKIPFGYYVSWTRDIGPSYSEENILTTSRMDILKSSGIALGKVDQTVSATLSNFDTATMLEIPVGRPLLVLDRSMYDADGELIDHMFALYRPDQYQFKMQFSMK